MMSGLAIGRRTSQSTAPCALILLTLAFRDQFCHNEKGAPVRESAQPTGDDAEHVGC